MVQSKDSTAGPDSLPDYARLLDAYHRAYAAELSEIVGTLMVGPGDRVLDLACGDGVYSRLLSDRVGSTGTVVGLDLSCEWIDYARSKDFATRTAAVQYCRAGVEQLPFANDSFDMVWCAQSFYSLPSPRMAVREMVRVARPGGVVGVLENDTLHHLLFPWPVEIELEARVAELQAFSGETSRPAKYYVGRRLSAEFLREGLEHVGEKTWATTRQAPWSEADRTFLAEYFSNLRQRIAPVMVAEGLARFDAWLGADGGQSVVDRPGFTTVCLDRLCWGIKSGMVRAN